MPIDWVAAQRAQSRHQASHEIEVVVIVVDDVLTAYVFVHARARSRDQRAFSHGFELKYQADLRSKSAMTVVDHARHSIENT